MAKTKRTFKQDREYTELPVRIAALEAEQKQLNAAVARPDFYREPADSIRHTMARIEALNQELLDALARWDALDSIAK